MLYILGFLGFLFLAAAVTSLGAKFPRFPRFLVIRKWGEFDRLAPSGFQWVWPLMEEGEEREEKIILVDNIQQKGVFTSDNIPLVVDCSLEWKFASNTAPDAAKRYLLAEQESGTAGVSKKLQQLLREVLLKVFRATVSMNDDRGNIMKTLDDATTASFKTEAMDKFGVEIVSFNLENYKFEDPAIEAGLQAPKKADLEAKAQAALRRKELERKATEAARGEADGEYFKKVADGEAERLAKVEAVKTAALKARADALAGKDWQAAVGASGVEIARAIGEALGKGGGKGKKHD
ncbi:MAG: SPFH domain-containing protein [Candidatus Falkowbacteria bacterium]